MTKWTIRKPDMYREIPEGGFTPRSGIAVLISALLYLIHAGLSIIPLLVQAVIFFVPRVGSGGDVFSLMDEYMKDPGTLLVSLFLVGLLILVTAFYVRRFEKRPLSTIGLSRGRILRRYIAGFGIGVMLLAITVWPAFLTEEVVWKGFTPIVALFFAAFVIQGAAEEVLFRGYLLSAISRKIGVFWGVVISSAFFASLHFVTIEGVLDVTVLFLLACLLALITVRTNSLWAACGLHTAWNFVSGLLSEGNAGGLNMDYAVVTIGDPNAPEPNFGFWGNPYNLLYVLVFAVLILLVLYAGKNRLVVRRPEGEASLKAARKFAKTTLPKEHLEYAQLIAKMVRTDDEKAAALLCLMLERGVSPQALADGGVGAAAGIASMLLVRRPGEDAEARRQRVLSNPVAEAVWHAQERYAADYAQRMADWQAHVDRYNQAMGAHWQGRGDDGGDGTN